NRNGCFREMTQILVYRMAHPLGLGLTHQFNSAFRIQFGEQEAKTRAVIPYTGT
ncbi:hypothetical protein EVA_04498, partial [gut metagenome]